jgi:hypothetical protein
VASFHQQNRPHQDTWLFRFGGEQRVWPTVARLLESGEISSLGQCLVCQKFFSKAHLKQVCCSKPARCGKTYDNRLRLERKAAERRQQRERRLQQQREQEKAQLEPVLREKLNTYLKGGPGVRRKAMNAYLQKLDAAPSMSQFMNELPPRLRSILKETYLVK